MNIKRTHETSPTLQARSEYSIRQVTTQPTRAFPQWSLYVELSVGSTGGVSIASLPQPYKGGKASSHISLDSPLSVTKRG